MTALRRLPVQVLLGGIALLWLVPTFGLLLTSLLPPSVIQSDGWWTVLAEPRLVTLDNYRAMFADRQLVDALVTTCVVAVGNTALLVLVSALAGYAFAWLPFPGRDALFLVVVGLLVVPLQVALIPIFSLYSATGLFDTAAGLILFHVAFGLPFGIFLLRNALLEIPVEVIESARLDGASEARVFTQLILPLSRPAIAALAIFQFLFTWNDLIVALTLGRATQPLTVAIFAQLRQYGANIDIIAPAAFISLAIPLAVFLSLQRAFTRGLLAGSTKG
ncbi:carbohydrate ABC transporter permease [Phytohabitans suffuscus]|uniref:Sugar ABC transporter permease n=1 Tax=Phytohabitans suffuscus TaxID=624315 RepID=A0A6F8Z1I2_9ACTN|nr:carbohydrate ABC transporter permease [Phytohabitans suffuscus]BCB91951.1 sugar ABC transporter permease [Phytohabitans suffuscus]